MELLWLLAVVFALFFVLTPLAMLLRLGDEQGMQFDPFDPSRHKTPPEVAAFLRDNIAALSSEQFQPVGDVVRRKDTGVRLTTRVALLRHSHGEIATIAVIYSDQGSAIPYVEFTAQLSGGRIFDVNNSSSIPVFAPRPGHDVYRFPEVRDPIRLYRIFQALLRRRFGSASLVDRDLSDPGRFLADVADKEYAAQMATGYYRFSEATRSYRPTLRGAFLMSWKMLPPFKQIAKAGIRARARRTLRDLRMEGTDSRPIATVRSVAPAKNADEPVKSTPLDWVILVGGMGLLFAGMFFVQRWTHSATLAVAFFLGVGPLGLWLWIRKSMTARVRAQGGDDVAVARARSNANRSMAPLGAVSLLALGLMGYSEYQAGLPNLMVPSDFDGAVQSLAQLTGKPVTQLEGNDSVYVVRVRLRWVNRYLSAAVPKFAAQHFFMSRFDRKFRSFRGDTSTVRLVLVPVLEPYDVLRLVGTRGAVDGQTPDEIAEGLRALHAAAPFEFRNIGTDWVRGAFTDSVVDPHRVSQRFNALCPRVLTEDFHGDVALLEQAIAKTGAFICRWQ
jgi:hypothetical protein